MREKKNLEQARLYAGEKSANVVHQESLSLNERIGIKVTHIVGSMWTAYIFALLALISLPAAIISHDPIVIVAWIAQTFIQLVLLPIIIVGQNAQSKHDSIRAEMDHTILSRLYEMQSIQMLDHSNLQKLLRHTSETAQTNPHSDHQST